jgi:hypothetical protein
MAKKPEGSTKATKYEVFVPSAGAYLVHVDGHEAANWRELEAEARKVTEPLVRERWLAYWKKAVLSALAAHQADDLRDIMKSALPPSPYYPCPLELGSKAVKVEGR